MSGLIKSQDYLMKCFGFVLLLGFISLGAIGGCNEENDASIISAWVQMGPSGSVIARVITDMPDCPNIKLDNVSQQMQVRNQPSEPEFPVLVCETFIPPTTTSASVSGKLLKLPMENPKRLVVIGDTGCRIKGDEVQACNDPQAWPFKKIAENAAAWDPDLIIHVGDYFYRETPCPEGNIDCADSPSGDNWESWDAEFFSSAASLLESAPWAFTRGNHESCARGGKGWFRFLDPHPPFPECEEFTPPYVIDTGFVQLLMLDTSSAEEGEQDAPQDLVDAYAEQIDVLSEAAGDNAWIVTHSPFWGIGESDGELFTINDALQRASGNSLKQGINLVLSGHMHYVELLIFEGDRSPQFVLGFSGTKPDSPVTVPLTGLEIAGAVIAQGVTFNDFGFATMEQAGDGWDVTVRNVDGEEVFKCAIVDNSAECFN